MGWHGITSFLLLSLLLVVGNAYLVRKGPSCQKGWCPVKLPPPLTATTTFADAISTTALPMALDAPIKTVIRRGGSSMITSG